MKRTLLNNISTLFVVMAILLSVIALPAMAATSNGTVTRSFSTSTPANGSSFTVSLTPSPAATFGLPGYKVIETIPAGFTVTANTATSSSNVGNVYTFINIGASAVISYTVTAPAAAAVGAFSGTFVDMNLDTGAVTGATTVNVGATTASSSSTLPRIWSVDKNPVTPYIWNSYNFEGFYYDIKYDRSTEELRLLTAPATLAAERTIQKNQLVYTTHGTPVQFKSNEKENVTVDGAATFDLEGWQAQKWIAVKGVSNKIAKLAFEMGKDDKKTLTTGETWALGAGYELTINAIDARTTPRQAWFTLKKDGAVIDEGIGQAPASCSQADKTKAVYFKKKTILGESDALLFTVYVDNIFSGATSDMVQFKYAWLIDESSAIEVQSADRYGVFEVRTASTDLIMMDNENTVSLSKNTEATIMGELKFNIADNDTLRFYPFVTAPTTGTYEVRGTVVQESTPGLVSWDSYNFAGFYYDLKYDRTTEQLSLLDTVSSLSAARTIQKNRLVYTTHGTPVQFKSNEKENVTVDGDATFDLEGWQAEKWIAVKGVSNKIAKLALEMGKDDKKTLTTGETWALGAGYELTINAIDARTTPRQAWFTLKKDGTVVDEGIGQAPASGSQADKTKAVYFKKKTILGESDALLFTVYVDNIFSGATSDMVQFKYAWLIDESSAKEIQSADRFGVFEVRTASTDSIMMDNENTVSLSKNTEATIMGNMKFVIADNDTLRFYPKVDIDTGAVGPNMTVTGATPIPTVTTTGMGTATLTAGPTETKPAEIATPVATTTTTAKATPTEPGFEAMFAIAGLLAVAFLVLRQRK